MKNKRNNNKLIHTLTFALLLSAFGVQASQGVDSMPVQENGVDTIVLRLALDKLIPNTNPDSIIKTGVSGLYEVSYGTVIYYFNKDASLMFKGDMVDMKSGINLTEKGRSKARVALIDSIAEKDMIVYPAQNEKYKVTVFTDIDCPYCVKLHKEMDQYNANGITMRYMAYPRAGVDSPSYNKIVSVWCNNDRKQAMSDAKNGKAIEQKTCKNPVAKQLDIGGDIGVRGTPAMFLTDGTMLPGYVSAARLKKMLDQRK